MKDLVKIHNYEWLKIFDILDYDRWIKWFDSLDDDNVEFKTENGKATFTFSGLTAYKFGELRLEYDGEFLKLFAEKKTKNSKRYESYFYEIDIEDVDSAEALFEDGVLTITFPLN